MTEEFNRKIKKAVEKLLTLEQVTLVGTFTSDYSYGMLPPCLQDRYNLDIKIDQDLTLKSNDNKQISQVSFDSKYLSFPPDIVVHNLPAEQSQDLLALLPQKDFDLDQETCLYIWFKRILNLFKRPEPKKRWPVFDDIPTRDPILHLGLSSSSAKRKYKEETRPYDTDMYHSDGDFIDDSSPYLQSKQEDMDIEKESSVYKQDRYKLKDKKDVIEDTGNFFADQDEALSYKTRAEEFENNLFKKKPPASDSSKTFNGTKRWSFDRMMSKAKLDGSDDDEIILHTVSTKKPSQPRPTCLKSPEPLRKKTRTLLKPKIFNLNSKTEENLDYRKKFMYEWLSRYKKNIVKYDTENYSNFTLAIKFQLSKSELYGLYKIKKEISMKKFLEEHPDVGKISKYKQVAPIMINFKMDKYSFPSTPLEIKLISVMNTTSLRSSEPDTMNLKYSITQNESLSKTVNDIMNLITDAVPAFHYQLDEE
ncbi:hypothetical protein BDF21DRAFT_428719 [Thamnidium elegans]|nr:hypothetical protein BDF21DRAFT_428719 [Thamnidium elegans]